MSEVNTHNFNLNHEFILVYISNDSEYSQNQKSQFEKEKDYFESQDVELCLLNSNEAFDQKIIDNIKESQQGLIVTNNEGKLIWLGLDLHFPNLVENMKIFFENYKEDTSATDLFKWGNKIEQNGDYMCNDCGYILTVDSSSEFKVGMAFPTCDVCQSGEPDGPAGPKDPFWQKL